MNLKHVEAFYWLCQLGTYQRVADRLHVTQPAVSARVRALEDFLKSDLIDRSQSRFALTERGQEIAVLAERMLDLKARMVRGDDPAVDRDRVRIAAISLTLKNWMPELVNRLNDLLPSTVVDVVSASDHQLTRYIPTAEIDVAFLSSVTPSVQLPRLFTVNYDVCWIGRADLLQDHRGTSGHERLARLPILHYPRTSPLFSLSSGIERGAGVAAHNANSLGSLIWMLEEGMGVAAIPAIAVADQIADGRLEVIETDPVPRVLKVRCAHASLPKRDVVSTILDAARDSARTTAERYPQWCSVTEGE